jgi:hypothetical protein
MKYCPDVWKSLYVEKKSTDSVSVGFCCQSDTTTVDNYAQLAKVQNTRRQNFEKYCDNCWKIENSGGQSRRHATINWFANNHVDQDKNPSLVTLDWNSENICNLACITCGPKFSSRWNQEIIRYDFDDANNYANCQQNVFWKTLDFQHLQRIYFNGGEPLLSKDHFQILTHLDTIGQLDQVEVAYNTNCTVIPDHLVLNLWKKARLVRLCLSIDAGYSAFEFIRWPAKWQQVLEFVEFIQSQSFNIIIDITCTLGIHNILELDDLLSWHKQHLTTNHQGDPVSFNIQPVGNISVGGNLLQLKNAGPKLTDLILPQLTTVRKHSAWSWISQQLLSGSADTGWINYLDQISEKRGCNWITALPRLANLATAIKN